MYALSGMLRLEPIRAVGVFTWDLEDRVGIARYDV